MDSLGNIPQIQRPQIKAQAPVLPQPSQAPSLPKIGANVANDVSFDAKSAELARFEAIRNAAKNAPQPLGSQTFTLFKDATGQVITRFRDLNSGKVTYIPEVQLFDITSAKGGSTSILNINA